MVRQAAADGEDGWSSEATWVGRRWWMGSKGGGFEGADRRRGDREMAADLDRGAAVDLDRGAAVGGGCKR